MINDLNPTELQMELAALLTFALILFLLLLNRDKNNKFEENINKLVVFLCIVLAVGMFIYMICTIAGGL